ncbi:MAG: endonuclease III [Clostridia bacterium]|nr:endonuclease III [Clostridia bacterium]
MKERVMNENQQAILKGLAELYPDAGPELKFTNPYETLVATILAAQCTDARVNQVTPAVFRDFPDAKAMARTTPEILFPYVKSCGFRSKAANIVNACKIIADKYDGVVPSTLEELTALPGVGRKTANVVLAFSFGQPAIPVDTHVFRVANRLGLSDALTVEETEKQLMALIPREDWSQAHHWMIFHGRRVCHSQKPECERCALKPYCKAAHQEEMINPKADAKKRARRRRENAVEA